MPEDFKEFEFSDEGGSKGNELTYSGYEPDLLTTSHEMYHLTPALHTRNERRHARIPARKAQACIRMESGESFIVSMLDISRGGACFTSAIDFHPGTSLFIATHYIEGGQNIFQLCRIVRVQHKPMGDLPGEYAVEFSLKATM
jgi:hypothetical protein